MGRLALLIGYGVGIGLGLAILAVGERARGDVGNPPPSEAAAERKPSTITDPRNAYRNGGMVPPQDTRKRPEPVIDGRDIPKVIEFTSPQEEGVSASPARTKTSPTRHRRPPPNRRKPASP